MFILDLSLRPWTYTYYYIYTTFPCFQAPFADLRPRPKQTVQCSKLNNWFHLCLLASLDKQARIGGDLVAALVVWAALE